MDRMSSALATSAALCLIGAACGDLESEPTVLGPHLDGPIAELTAPVVDLQVSRRASRSLPFSWTQVDDGTGSPARYRVKYGSPTMGAYRTVATASTSAYTGAVDDLRVRDELPQDVTSTRVVLVWTQVDDGTGEGARYRIKYASPTIESWRDATIGCGVRGWDDHSPITCALAGLTPGTDYEFQLMSYRLVDGVWQGARYSNKTQARTKD